MKLSKDAAIGEAGGLEARRSLGLGETQPLDDILRALERTTQLQVFARPLGEDGVAGAFWSVRETPFILVNATHAPQRQRFSLAHEFGHFWLKHGNTYDVKVSWSHTSPKETQANYFAASFLMPAPAVSEALTRMGRPDITFEVLVQLATIFGVSAQAMRLRLAVLDHIRGKRVTEFDALIEQEAHHGLPQALGIVPMTDTLSVGRNVGHMPPTMTAKALRGADRNLLQETHVIQLLRLGPEQLANVRETFEVVAE